MFFLVVIGKEQELCWILLLLPHLLPFLAVYFGVGLELYDVTVFIILDLDPSDLILCVLPLLLLLLDGVHV